MSSHDEPYANGFGILLGVAILWIGTLALMLAGKAGYDAFFGKEKDEGATQNAGDAQSYDLCQDELERLVGPTSRIG